ncbi:recombinase family protein [Bacillus massilinigeriensis]|nr:recombinase family protein [Bacillus massilionigeriensis]
MLIIDSKNKNLTAINYYRKSIKVSGMSEEESINYQHNVCNDFAKRNGIEVLETFNDIGYTGAVADRPELH